MTQDSGGELPERHPACSPPPSSFPISSPSFWSEVAVTVDATAEQEPGRVKRPPDDQNTGDEGIRGNDGEAGPRSGGVGLIGTKTKRARFLSPPPSATAVLDEAVREATPLREVKPALGSDQEGRQDEAPSSGSRTALSYLPNRLDPHLFDATNAYLASAEYAPNKFGDIGDYMRKKEIKVQTQNRDIAIAGADPNLPQIFKDQSFWINGNTHPPMEELRKMILQRGGEVRPKLWNKGCVKYIIAPMLTQMKFKEFRNYKVVKEGWIVESCKAGKLLDWSKWKLQVQGGWEETGRKGLEGFLRGEASQSQRVSQVKHEDQLEADDDEEEEMVEPWDPVATNTESAFPPALPVANAVPATPSAKRSTAAATQSLIAPASSRPTPAPTPIPISPGFRKAATAAAEGLPAKIHRPEGAWEHYYTKDSNEHAAEALKNSDWRIRNTAERGNEGGFIDGYYQNSRLHHLSTWKAELKVLVAAAQKQSEENALSRPSHSTVDPYSLKTAQLPKSVAPPVSTTPGDKVVFHVDFDCFFVSCGLATRPHLRGLPSVVCHSQLGKTASTSEIASASYEARAKGVKNGMSLGRAKQLVGDSLQTIPYEFDTYKKFSLAFYTVLMGYADELQAVSVDEALIDVTNAVRARELAPEEALDDLIEGDANGGGAQSRSNQPRNAAVEIAEKIRDDVRKLTDGCEVSIGIAHNVLLAKLATRAAKPAGVYHLRPAVVPDFLQDLDVKDLPSIGYSTANKIEEKFGTTKCGSLLEVPKTALQKTLGPKTGEMVFGYLRGQDDRKLEPHKERKSISAEMNYGIRFRNQDQADVCIRDLAAEVAKRLKQNNVRGRLLTLKLMSRHPDAPVEPPKFLGHGWCETFNKSTAISNKGGSATDDPAILGSESVKLLRTMKLDPVELRGVGIQITKLEGEVGKPAGSIEREAGQGLLSFAKGKKPAIATVIEDQQVNAGPVIVPVATDASVSHSRSNSRSLSKTASPQPEQEPPHELAPLPPAAVAGPSRLAAAASSDSIDPEFLAALPADLRQEVKRDHAVTRARTRERAESERPTLAGNTTKHSHDAVRATTVSPAKAKGMHKAAHITKQLRPRVKTQLKAAAISDLPLYGAWNKAQQEQDDEDDEIVVLSTPQAAKFNNGDDDGNDKIGNYFIRDLRELGIDPSFLRDLPVEMQKEVVDAETARRKKRQLLHRPADTSRVQARARERERERTGAGAGVRDSASPSRGRTSRAGSAAISGPAIPRLTIARPAKPKLYNASTLPEVTDVITKWIDSRGGSGPAARDANKVQTYLLKCLDQSSGLGGVEMAVEVLKYMRVAIDARWEEGSCEDGDDIAGTQWWATWATFRAAVDTAHRQRFGVGLRL